ncbi:transglutaminase family protein [Streptomyces sp. B1866]|uniref:transglutaminase-like domain-containing protein n=1 Tax=Streptomyces sp. B1866 TaxID=3075431 RepID=UPI0028918180|nr:transglutaminase family protein [Streptomyces sp. B1866]MDT3399022.1 transglutaminase family protein [Streptomyces sp. B1866]
MELRQDTPDLSAYLRDDDVVDHRHPVVRDTAARLRARTGDAYSYAEAAFEFVRDTIPHSADSGDERVSCRASVVLATRNGICFAKSHALVALLRAEGIPAGFCYQKLDTLHGLIALRLPGHGRWARQDPRGNKPGVDARFRLDREQLAWQVRPEFNEIDYPVVYTEPHPVVLTCLREAVDRSHLWQTLPTELPRH